MDTPIVVMLVVLAIVAIVAGTFAFRSRGRIETTIEPAPARPPAPVEPGLVDAIPSDAADVPAAPVAAIELFEEPSGEPVKANLRSRLGKTRAAFGGYLRAVAGRRIDDEVYDELEEALLLADVGVATTNRLLDGVRAQVSANKVTDADAVVAMLRGEIEAMLSDSVDRSLRTTPDQLSVWMFVGVNGVGKTTTIGKLAAQRSRAGGSVMLAAADTFRAAAAEQLTQWAARAGVDIVRGDEGADPGAIVFDAMASATSKGVDLLLVDTAGRLHNKNNLMAELEKLRRIVDRTEGALHEVLLVIDATTGQNGLQQAKQFAEAVDVTGIVLTKLDGTAKGGIVLAIQAELGLPVKVVGVGETVGDLIEFDPAEFVAALFEG